MSEYPTPSDSRYALQTLRRLQGFTAELLALPGTEELGIVPTLQHISAYTQYGIEQMTTGAPELVPLDTIYSRIQNVLLNAGVVEADDAELSPVLIRSAPDLARALVWVLEALLRYPSVDPKTFQEVIESRVLRQT